MYFFYEKSNEKKGTLSHSHFAPNLDRLGEESPSTTLSDSSHLFALTLTLSHSHSSAKNPILKLAPPAHTHTQHITLTLTLPKKITRTKDLNSAGTWSNYSSSMLNTWYYDILYPNTKLLQVIDLDPHCIHKHCGFFLMKNPEYVCVGKKLSNVIWIF